MSRLYFDRRLRMSLCCDETGRTLQADERIWAATRRETDQCSVLSREVFERIKNSIRRERSERGDGGLDIHEAEPGSTLIGKLSRQQFKFGKFLFSISRETAMQCMPNVSAHYESRRPVFRRPSKMGTNAHTKPHLRFHVRGAIRRS